MPARARAAQSRNCAAGTASPSAARPSKTGFRICGRFSIFSAPGLLGGAKEFAAFLKSRSPEDPNQFAPLRRLVRPYILRRLKTDKRIISDLPEKTEMTAFCPLTRRQAALYQQSVNELAERLEAPETEGIQRRGIILAFLTRFKQICNHPSQWLGDGAYAPADSGKFHRLRELCEEIASKQEKVLVFTQYREITDPLARYLATVFGQAGAGAAWRHAGCQAQGIGGCLSTRRRPAVFCALTQSRRHRA